MNKYWPVKFTGQFENRLEARVIDLYQTLAAPPDASSAKANYGTPALPDQRAHAW